MNLGCQRELFEIPEDVAYLNCAYMSPLLRSVREAGQEAVARKSTPWRIGARDFFDESETARAMFARLVGADAEGVAIVPSVSYGIAVAALNLEVQPGQGILLLDEEFPSDVYAWREVARRSGASIVTVPAPKDHDWTTAVLQLLDERTAVVVIPNCHWTDGSLVDLRRVGERAREVGAALVVDAIQSLGAVPLDVSEVRPDFLMASAYKWLLGPYSVGFLYVAPQHREGTPLEYGWLTRAGSEDFAGLVLYRDDYQPGARRYDVGERCNFALLPMAIAALEQILSWGVPDVHETVGELTAQVERAAAGLGLRGVPAACRGGHMIGIRSPDGFPPDLPERLAAATVHVSLRGRSIRVSPHVYNTPEDVQRLFAVLADVL